MAQQLHSQDMGFASSLLNQGRGTTTTGTGTAAGATGGGLGGAFSDFGTMLGYLIASGAFKKKAGAGGPPLYGVGW